MKYLFHNILIWSKSQLCSFWTHDFSNISACSPSTVYPLVFWLKLLRFESRFKVLKSSTFVLTLLFYTFFFTITHHGTPNECTQLELLIWSCTGSIPTAPGPPNPAQTQSSTSGRTSRCSSSQGCGSGLWLTMTITDPTLKRRPDWYDKMQK